MFHDGLIDQSRVPTPESSPSRAHDRFRHGTSKFVWHAVGGGHIVGKLLRLR